jgi:hypothetical protein
VDLILPELNASLDRELRPQRLWGSRPPTTLWVVAGSQCCHPNVRGILQGRDPLKVCPHRPNIHHACPIIGIWHAHVRVRRNGAGSVNQFVCRLGQVRPPARTAAPTLYGFGAPAPAPAPSTNVVRATLSLQRARSGAQRQARSGIPSPAPSELMHQQPPCSDRHRTHVQPSEDRRLVPPGRRAHLEACLVLPHTRKWLAQERDDLAIPTLSHCLAWVPPDELSCL